MSKQTLDLLNNIRLNASAEYQARVPEATQESFITIGVALQNYTLQANEFIGILYGQIGRTIIEQKAYKNKLGRFKSGTIVTPKDVQEIFVEMAKAEGAYDKDGKNPLGRRPAPEIKVAYHRKNREYYFAKSIGDIDFISVFRSEATFDAFVKSIIESIYIGDEYDEWLAMKNLLASYKNVDEEGNNTEEPGYYDYEVLDMSKHENKTEFAKAFVKAVRKGVQDVSFMSDKYNIAGVKTKSDANELVLLVHKDVLVEVDVELLAKAFHTDNTDLKVVPTIISMDDFGDLPDTYALMVDEDWFKVWDTLIHMEPQRNAQGLFTNYFYHHHQIMSASPFKTALRFKRVDAAAQ